jgi:predicted MFS family arabinose efflux permease
VSGIKRPASNRFPFLQAAVLSSVSMSNFIDRISLSLPMQPIKHELHLTDAQMGLISGLAFALFYALLGLPIARIANRGFKTWLFPACVLLRGRMTILSGAAVSFATLFVARMLADVEEAGCSPASLAEQVELRCRSMAIGLFHAGGLPMVSALLRVEGWDRSSLA